MLPQSRLDFACCFHTQCGTGVRDGGDEIDVHRPGARRQLHGPGDAGARQRDGARGKRADGEPARIVGAERAPERPHFDLRVWRGAAADCAMRAQHRLDPQRRAAVEHHRAGGGVGQVVSRGRSGENAHAENVGGRLREKKIRVAVKMKERARAPE